MPFIWNTGILEYWNIGILEYWVIKAEKSFFHCRGKKILPNYIPLFHHSNRGKVPKLCFYPSDTLLSAFNLNPCAFACAVNSHQIIT